MAQGKVQDKKTTKTATKATGTKTGTKETTSKTQPAPKTTSKPSGYQMEVTSGDEYTYDGDNFTAGEF